MPNKILVLNGRSYARPVEGLGEIVYNVHEFAAEPENFKLVLFTGGEDVTPSFYGETSPRRMCGCSPSRDMEEKQVFDLAFKHGILMTGICRGIQFMNVMAGGRLMHHITGHAGSQHNMSMLTGGGFRVNSLHHQMVIPSDFSIVVGWSTNRISHQYVGDADSNIDYYGQEVEAAIFPEIKGFGVQYHPEMMAPDSEGALYYRQMVINAFELTWSDFLTAYTEGLNDIRYIAEVSKPHYSAGR